MVYILQATDISKHYKKTILNHLSFHCEKGEIIGIAGENGSGKTTLLHILTSTVQPDSGTVLLDDVPLLNNPALLRKHIGFVPQDNYLFEKATVRDNIGFWCAAFNVPAKQIFSLYDKDLLKKKVFQLSGGMKKRLSIDIALINDPDYLIMDEPTSSLDLMNKERVYQLVHEFKEKNKAVIFTSHQQDELALCDRIYIIQNGGFVYQDAPHKIGSGADFKKKIIEYMTVGS